MTRFVSGLSAVVPEGGHAFAVADGSSDGSKVLAYDVMGYESVVAHGADNTGVADSSAAFQSAIDAAVAEGHYRVYVPEGTYIAEGVSVPNKVWILGAGENETTIRPPDPQTDHVIKVGASGSDVDSGGLVDIGMLGRATQFGIFNRATMQSEFDAVHFETSGSDAIEMWTVRGCFIRRFRCAVYCGGRSRANRFDGNRLWENYVGVWIEDEHPLWDGVNDIRRNCYGVSGDVIFDMHMVGQKINYNKFGIETGALGTESENRIENTTVQGGWMFENKVLAIRMAFQCTLDGVRITPPSSESIDSASLDGSSLSVTCAGVQFINPGDPIVFEGTGEDTNVTASITGATAADVCEITAVGHPFLTGDRVAISAVGGMTELNGNTYRVTRIDADSFYLDGADSGGFSAYTSGGTATLVLDGSENFTVRASPSNNVYTINHDGVELDATGVNTSNVAAGSIHQGTESVLLENLSGGGAPNGHRVLGNYFAPNASSRHHFLHPFIRIRNSAGARDNLIAFNQSNFATGLGNAFLHADLTFLRGASIAGNQLGRGTMFFTSGGTCDVTQCRISDNVMGYMGDATDIGQDHIVSFTDTTHGNVIANNVHRVEANSASTSMGYVWQINARRSFVSGNYTRRDNSQALGGFNILAVSAETIGAAAGVDQAGTTSNNVITTF